VTVSVSVYVCVCVLGVCVCCVCVCVCACVCTYVYVHMCVMRLEHNSEEVLSMCVTHSHITRMNESWHTHE